MIVGTRIIIATEETPNKKPNIDELDLSRTNEAFLYGAALIAEKINARRIVTITHSGNSGAVISRFRPRTHVLGVTNVQKVARKICLYWGISPFYIDGGDSDDSAYLEFEIMELIKERLGINPGDKIVVTRGEGPLFKSGESNSLKVITVKNHIKQ
jgi:pyruvate kinase